MLHKIEKTNNQPQRHRDAEETPFGNAEHIEVSFSPRLSVSAVRFIVLILPILLSLTGCYRTITGTVIDAETGKPIEGAVILAEWTKTVGFGYTGHKSYKVIEAVTDKDGKATIEGVFSLLANYPSVTVYKKGYVAWNNEYIFPDSKKRENFSWSSGYVFRLERFKPEYSYDKHMAFVDSAINASLGLKNKDLFIDAYREAEFKKVREELDKKEGEGRK